MAGPPKSPDSVTDVHRAYVTGLKLVAQRERSAAQVRLALERRHFTAEAIDSALERLERERAVDDQRAAAACARTETHVRRHGRRRVLRTLEARGIKPDVARAAVRAVFADVNEDELLEQVLESRLRRVAVLDQAVARRVHRFLLAQGFDADKVNVALRRRMRTVPHDDD